MQHLRKGILLWLCIATMIVANAQVLYEISGNGTHGKSYLLATNKYTDRAFLDTIPNLFKVYGRCKRVVTEFAMQDYELISALRKAALLPDSVVLKNFYSDKEYNDINQSLTLALGIGFEQLGRMQPAFLSELYRTELMRKWLDYNEKESMETFFEQVAQATDIPVKGLDGLGETIYMMFEREPMHYQFEELKRITENPEREVRLEKNIREMYKQGRVNDIAFLLTSPDNMSSLSYSDYQVFALRNQEWVKRLAPLLKPGKTFITLNAIYIGGDKGLLAELKKAGYRVRPVNRTKIFNTEKSE